MSRNTEFFSAYPEQNQTQDSRFNLRSMPMNESEVPSIFTYADPGRGPNGEHQS